MPETLNPFSPGEPDHLREIESLFAGLKPATPALNRDTFMFQAGRAAATTAHRRSLRLWQGCFTAALLLASALSLQSFTAGKPTQSTRFPQPHEANPQLPLAQISNPAPAPSPADLDATLPASPNYLQLRRIVLAQGTQVLHSTTSPNGYHSTAPALNNIDGLDSLPPWQQHAALSKGDRS